MEDATNFDLPAAPRIGLAPMADYRFTIYAGRSPSSAMHFPVISITTSAHKRVQNFDAQPINKAQRYRYHLAILLDNSQFPGTDNYYRWEGFAASRKEAIKAIRTFIHDSFSGRIPERTTLRLERGQDRPFPEDASRPFAVSKAA